MAMAGLLMSACSGSPQCVPESDIQQVVCERQQGFRDIGKNLKIVDDEVKSGDPDYQKVAESAMRIVETGKSIPHWFPEGSGPEVGIATDAKAEIWSDPDKFSAAYQEFVAESERLVSSAATENFTALQAQFHATGAACSNCHKPFRVDK